MAIMDSFRPLLVLAVMAMALPSAVDATRSHPRFAVPAYFAFGDSLADVGTNNFLPQATARADFKPYGMTFFKKPTGRFTNGRNLVDFAAQALQLPFAPPFLQPGASFAKGVNFASSGSGLLDSTSAGKVIPMSVQVQQFSSVKATLQEQLGEHSAATLISRSIFLILSGSNDLSSFLGNPKLQQQMNATEFLASMIGAYQKTLLDLYSLGARKVVVVGAGPIGCSPLARAANPTAPGECVGEANQLAKAFNAGLKTLGVRAKPGVNVVLFDALDTIAAMISDGAAFGLQNVSAACCGAGFLNAQAQCGKAPNVGAVAVVCKRPSQALFWDYLHPTEAVVRILAQQLLHGNASVAYPINLQALADL